MTRRVWAVLSRFVRRHWKVVALFALVVLMLLFAPEEDTKFIYTEF